MEKKSVCRVCSKMLGDGSLERGGVNFCGECVDEALFGMESFGRYGGMALRLSQGAMDALGGLRMCMEMMREMQGWGGGGVEKLGDAINEGLGAGGYGEMREGESSSDWRGLPIMAREYDRGYRKELERGLGNVEAGEDVAMGYYEEWKRKMEEDK